MRALAHYFFIFGVMTIYGSQVCPFIDTLPVTSWALVMLAFLGGGFLLRRPLEKRIVSGPPERQAGLQFRMEVGVFLASGLLVTAFDSLAYGFPVASGLKVVLGYASMGFLAAADLAFARERKVIALVKAGGPQVAVGEKYFPLTKRFLALAVASVAMVAAVAMLLIYRDLELVSNSAALDLKRIAREIFMEIIFVGLVFLGLLANLAYSFSINLKEYLANQNLALEAVTAGDLEASVPVAGKNEFGVMASYTNKMIDTLRSRTQELSLTQDATITALASLAETRDNETGAHILRTQRYVRALAEHLAGHPDFSSRLDRAAVELLFKSAPLHDVGKVGVPDSILLKPGKLDFEEFEEMKRHTVYGKESLESAERMLGGSSFLHLSREIAYCHHEKWDGSGYPRGLSGGGIPLSGRLMALADVFDALISKRVYKPAFDYDKARAIILEGEGGHFDPRVVRAFLALEEEFKRIAHEFADGKECRLTEAC